MIVLLQANFAAGPLMQSGERKFMPEKTKHQLALDLVSKNLLADAADLLAQAIGEGESAELWNDWATVKIALHRSSENEAKNNGPREKYEALAGYERALELEPANPLNFGWKSNSS